MKKTIKRRFAVVGDLVKVIDVEQLAELLRTTPDGIYSRRYEHSSLPTPFQTRPLLWTLRAVECWIAGCELKNSEAKTVRSDDRKARRRQISQTPSRVTRETLKAHPERPRTNVSASGQST